MKEPRMRRPIILLLALPAWVLVTASAADAQPPKPALTGGHTGRPSKDALAPAAVAGKNDGTAIPADTTADAFKGDAVLSNGRIVAVLRQQDSAVEVYAARPDGAVARLRLR